MMKPHPIRLPAIAAAFIFILSSCSLLQDQEPQLFESILPEESGVDFINQLTSTSDFNVYRYRNFYNGGGVAAGDLNGDSLPDLYLISNSGANKLYLNRGDFKFEDVTQAAGVSGNKPWSAGVSLVDINGNGLLDIYVTNSGEFEPERRRNELFINNGDGTFTESAAEYGLDDPGYSIHASFFDYDGDGDLDMYLLNNSDAAIADFELSDNQRMERDEYGGDKLFRNDDGLFTDVSAEAGIYGSEIGFSLSATVSDVNRDGWPDIYIANDFFERDYLYLNNTDGTFREVLTDQMNSISAASMGADIADLTNNGWPDIYVSDMLPLTDERTKKITTYENWELFTDKESWGYHYQVTRNTLQLNNGNGTYSEIGRYSDVQASDWSWAVLLADFDLNGFNDILVTNGLLQDITNLDYIQEINNPDMIRSIISDQDLDFSELIEMIPSNPVPNVLFANNGDLTFEEKAEAWGIGEPGFSSGAVWADLDADGDLDLVINDVNNPAKLYQNHSLQTYPDRGSLKLTLQGKAPNTLAIGAQAEAWSGDQYWFREHYLQRGYQSSVEPGIFIGTGLQNSIDSLRVTWPNGTVTTLTDISLPSELSLVQPDTEAPEDPHRFSNPSYLPGDMKPAQNGLASAPLLTDISGSIGLGWEHQRFDYNDFNRELLLVHMRSSEGPALCKADVNRDGLDDLYIGGGRNQPGVLVRQDETGNFSSVSVPDFMDDESAEDTDCAFFDATGNGYPDLYVTSGGNSYSTGSSGLLDRLYLNDGNGMFRKSANFLPTGSYSSNSTVTPIDINGDESMDLFVGERLKLFNVGQPARGFLMLNDGNGQFTDVTAEYGNGFDSLGMITSSAAIDWDMDGMDDLAITGEWMHPMIFRNTGNGFELIPSNPELSRLRGLWMSLTVDDLDGDGRDDLILGNLGLNTHFRTSTENPLRMWVGDFQNNGVTDQILSRSVEGRDLPFVLKHDLFSQIPSLQSSYPTYESYASQSMSDLFDAEQLETARVLQADILENIVIYNRESGPEWASLPPRAQFTPVHGILSKDLDGDQIPEIVLSGNLIEAKPMAGPYDAGYGTALVMTENGEIKSLPPQISGLSIPGSGRDIISLQRANGDSLLVIARNNGTPLFYRINR
ncbi:VCBS repeat-containing protein [Rhodohalobacter mucosus]|uniref:ASPIC/UnbV domain-containing protein n=1 Tax=Rhodohalobacter mucosus TaxID=2079485 RepID=A0A316TPZ0_9BACT|nr:VCBS repeat-containing protein [Rhodohalobacter mucosus]PWN06693.1 hypothetical protein DDZ15_09265 [Rhodohalobacter mucosus]